MKTMLLVVLLPALLLVLIVAIVLLRNMPVWLDEPGLKSRLVTALTMNQAEMSEHPEWPELASVHTSLDENEARQQVLQAITQLGWEIVSRDGEIHALVSSPIIGFKDDVFLSFRAKNSSILLLVRSKSRVGKADFSANASHLLNIARFLQQQFGWK